MRSRLRRITSVSPNLKLFAVQALQQYFKTSGPQAVFPQQWMAIKMSLLHV
jgi:hypothetical protein